MAETVPQSKEDFPNTESQKNESCEGSDDRNTPCFHVVAVGASAGGLESLEAFFHAMPSDSGMAFVVLQHLSPDFRSLMDELLARHTKMKIRKAEDDMELEPNTIYLNPPRKNMIVSGGSLFLSDVDPEQSVSLPIDQFFRSLAQEYRKYSIAIVLSGTGSDGSRGIRDVYEAGGLVLSETEETAKFDGMPRSAHDTGYVHLVLPADAMPEALTSYVSQSLSPQDFVEKEFVPPSMGGLETVFRLIRNEYDIDFSHYKPNTVVRRVERRVSLGNYQNIDAYIDHLRNDSEELNSLYRDLLIGVTQFFRDRDAFEAIRKHLLPDLLAEKNDGDELRIWVAGCATGEEAYSLAILVSEALERSEKNLDVKIFATDIHPVSLEFASVGIYGEDSVAQVDESLLRKYFRPVEAGYQVQSRLRQMLVFAKHNVFKDAPFTKLDMVSCRNLLIYLQPLAQKKALSLFHFGLVTQGILFLGPSESPGELRDEFEACNNRWKIYRKRRNVKLPADLRLPLQSGVERPAPLVQSGLVGGAKPFQRDILFAYDKILERYIQSAFLIDEERSLIHVFGGAAKYLVHKGGRFSTDFLDLIRSDLKPILASILQQIRRSAEQEIATQIRLSAEEEPVNLKIRVTRIQQNSSPKMWFVVSFLEEPAIQDNTGTPEMSVGEFTQGRMDDLEQELRYTKESLQTTVEELETSNEELQATNEELVASNEELQSTNEELHSVNEELYTVNAEYQNKIGELTELTEDMDNLLESTEIGTIFLDEKLSIRKFTGKIGQWFDFVSKDVGRKITTFSNSLDYGTLHEDLERVLQQNMPIEHEIQDRQGKWLHLRIHPYRRDGDPVGVVMTLIDISNLRKTRAKLQQLSAIVENSDDAIIGKSFLGNILSWNPAAELLFGYSAQEAIGKDISLILLDGLPDEALDYVERIRRGESVDTIEVERRTKDGHVIDIAVRFSPIRNEDGIVTGMSAICRDITKQKNNERELFKLSLVAKHTDNAVIITDAEGLTDWVNEGFTRITEYGPEEVRGKKPGQILQGPESDPRVVQEMREKIAAEEGFNVEILNYSKSGRQYWLSIEAEPLHDDTGTLSGFMAVERDITQLKSAQKRAKEEVDRRDQFLAMLSHELRNPLGALKSGLELLDTDPHIDADRRANLEGILRTQVNQMVRLLDDLLDVSRITQEKVIIKMTTVDLRTTARDAVSAIAPLAQNRQCSIELDLPSEPLFVCGDAARLQQVQANLLSNAVKHSPLNGIIRCRLAREEQCAVITISDQGDGIEPEVQERIFDLFYQTDSEISRGEGGLGVGLSLVKDFVEKHNGTVQVRSAGRNQGTTFMVRLPLESSSSTTLIDAVDAGDLPPLKIVIIEDQDANRYLLRSLLSMDGHQLWEASSGQEGVRVILEQNPDLALVDIGLPDIAGFEVARQVKSAEPPCSTLLVALSGYSQQSDVAEGIAAGFDAHLVKPLDMSELLRVLKEKLPTNDSATNLSTP